MSTSNNQIKVTIRAPSHLEDHVVVCEPHWTVKNLKETLSKTYPGKPEINSQRLIFGGKYMQDDEILISLLKETNYQQIVHLVVLARERSNTAISLSTSSNNVAPPTAAVVGLPSELRYRHSATNVITSHNTTNMSWEHWSPQQMMAAYYQQYGYPAYDGQPQSYDNYAESWRQYHMQVNNYMQRYWSMANTASLAPEAPPAAETMPFPPLNHPPQAANVPEANPPMNAQGGAFGAAIDEDDDVQHDWLDALFGLFRYTFFFSIVYLYSDWWRFLMVATISFLMYIYQAGYFRLRRRRIHPDEGERQNNANEAQNGDSSDTDDNNNSSNNLSNQSNIAEPEPPSFFASAWCFISTFFTSLIPQPPPVT